MAKEQLSPPAPKLKATLADFIACVPPEWSNAQVGIAVEKDGFLDQGFYQIRRIILTVDNNGRRCVLFSRLNTNIN